MKIYDLIMELGSFVTISPEIAKKASYTTKKVPKDLLRGWTSGAYDESPELLLQELSFLL